MRTSEVRTSEAITAVAKTAVAIISEVKNTVVKTAVVKTAVVKTVEVKNTARRGKSFLRKQGIPVLFFQDKRFFRNDWRLDGAGTLAPTPPLYPFPTWGVNNVFPNL